MLKAAYVVSALLVCVFFAGSVRSENPDFGDSAGTAEAITADANFVTGYLETDSDQDWFVLIPTAETMYRVYLNAWSNDEKRVVIYQENYFGGLLEVEELEPYDETEYADFYAEHAYGVYLKVYGGGTGSYNIEVETLGSVPVDSYGDWLGDANVLTLTGGGVTVEGVLDTADPNHVPSDYFTFDAEEHHRYTVSLGGVASTVAKMEVFTSDYARLGWYNDSFTLVPASDADYIIGVYDNIYAGGGGVTSVGNYYKLQISEEGPLYDDYSNTRDGAYPIEADGTWTVGEAYAAQINDDIDWFAVDVNSRSLYRISLDGGEYSGIKDVRIYYENYPDPLRPASLDLLYETSEYDYLSSNVISREYFVNLPGTIFIQVRARVSDCSYVVAAELLEEMPEDLHPDTCGTAEELSPDEVVAAAGNTSGTFFDANAGVYYIEDDPDYFYFDAEADHWYWVLLQSSDESILGVDISAGCPVSDWAESFEQGDYKIYSFVSEEDQPMNIHVTGTERYLGNYYELRLVDKGYYGDAESDVMYGDPNAVMIPTDGTPVIGSIDYDTQTNRDVDYLVFDVPVAGDYDFEVSSRIYQGCNFRIEYLEDGTSTYVTKKSFEVDQYHTESFTLNFEGPGDGIIHAWADTNRTGPYRIRITDPQPRCGDPSWPSPAGDVTDDCVVDFLDIAELGEGWLDCSSPGGTCD